MGGKGGVISQISNAINQGIDTTISGTSNTINQGVDTTLRGTEGAMAKYYSNFQDPLGIQSAARTAAETGKESNRIAQEQIDLAKEQQAKREADIAAQDEIKKGQKKSASLRARQRASGGGGRQSTILTEGLGSSGSAGATSGKTLLGS